MKKYITFLLLVLLMPALVFAKGNYESKTLEEALKDENIEYDLGDYKESDDKVNIYLFRGKGCSHCHEFLEYVSSDLVKKYGDKFNLVTYEVWQNRNNSELMQEVASYLGEEASGVPFIVIGDKSFSGYAKSMNSELESAIDSLYNSQDKYDVLKEKESHPKVVKKEKKNNVLTITFIALAGLAIIVILMIQVLKIQNRK